MLTGDKMRKFRLLDGNGTEYNLTTRAGFLHSPKGLGYEKDITFQRVGNLFRAVNQRYAQGAVDGEIFFPEPNAYQKYFDFVQYAQNDGLILLYNPAGAEYRCNVELTKVGKMELQACGLNIDVTFTMTTMWYKTFDFYNDGEEAASGKIYPYNYPYVYVENASNTIAFDSDSMIESPLRIYIYGAAKNPTWAYYLNNELVGTGKVTGTIPAGNVLLIDTSSIPYQIKQIDGYGNVVSDMYPLSDFSTVRFFRAHKGVNRISAGHEETTALKLKVEAQLLYASV